MKEKRVIYYKNTNEEFSRAKISPKKIGDDYVYIKNSPIKKFTRFFWYRIIATPIAFLYVKLRFHQKTIYKNKLKNFKKSGYFLVGNHTQDVGDALMPSIFAFPKSVYSVVHPNNVSMPLLGKITPSLGALPLPDTGRAAKNFFNAIQTRINEGCAVVIYPEAHIWPYYTKIRPFNEAAFRFPIRFNAPTFCFTNTYQKRKIGKKPKIITYIDGPFYPDETLSQKERQKKLCDDVCAAMNIRAENSNCEHIIYKYKEDTAK